MSKRETVEKLEALIDSLRDSLEMVSHNGPETEFVLDYILKFQMEYKDLTGDFYRPKHL